MLDRREFVRTALLGAGAWAVPGCMPPPVPARSRPNFIIVLTDDQGYGDVGCFGARDVATPRLDRMAREGLQLTSFYSQPVCGPARASLLTGCYPPRVMRGGWSLDGDEFTVAEALKGLGYSTACIGKWDLSGRENVPGKMANDQGFDEFFGTLGVNENTGTGLWHNRDRVDVIGDMGALTGRYTDEAIRVVRSHGENVRRDSDTPPYFLLLSHNMPHVPLGVSPPFRGRSGRRTPYGDAVVELDYHIGRLLDVVAGSGRGKDTVVLFASDNGPWLSEGVLGGSAGPLRMGKGSSWEGGSRVPAILWGPSWVPAGRTSDEIVSTLDVLPTFVSMACGELPGDRTIDGVDQSALFCGRSARSARSTFCYYVRDELQAVRMGRWKLALPGRTRTYPFAVDKVPVTTHELYDLATDIGETRDVAAHHPDLVHGLRALADLARWDIGDRDHAGVNAR